jgi:hypothetical protein
MTKENISNTINEIKAVTKEGAKNVPMEVETFRKAFDQLKDAGIKQLVVLVDDLIVVYLIRPLKLLKRFVYLYLPRGQHLLLLLTRL